MTLLRTSGACGRMSSMILTASNFPSMKSPGRWASSLIVASLGAFAACDGGTRAIDAATPVESRAAQIELRIDVVPDKPASLTVLAYGAVFSGISGREVLGLVDPLAGAGASRPAGECELRDLDRASAELALHGDAIELRELKGIAVASVGDGAAELVRLSPRMFPDIAASIGGVVAEGGPVRLFQFPPRLQINQSAPSTDPAAVALPLPAPAWLKQINGLAAASGATIQVGNDLKLTLTVAGKDVTSVELRPFGATVALACAVPLGGVSNAGADGPVGASELAFGISRQMLSGLVTAAGGAPGAPIAAALDVVRRTESAMAPSGTDVALEIRTSTLVELRP